MPRITMIGAGSIVFAKRMISDVLSCPELEGSTLALMDIDAHRLDLISRLAKRMVSQSGRRVQVTATEDRREALRGATYVMNMIQVGGLDAYETDIAIPRKYGVEQCVGDTLGPGGIFRAVRTWPVLRSIAADIEELAPDAVLLNFTNPMAINVWALSRVTSIPSIGLCHNVNLTAERLAGWVGVPFAELGIRVGGINHMVWFLQLRHNGQDMYPRLREAMQRPDVYAEDPVRFDLLRHAVKLDPLTGAVCSLDEIERMVTEMESAYTTTLNGRSQEPVPTRTGRGDAAGE